MSSDLSNLNHPDTTPEVSKPDLTVPQGPSIDKLEMPASVESEPTPFGFCRPRNQETIFQSITRRLRGAMGGINENRSSLMWILPLACVGGILAIILIYHILRHYDLIQPFVKGGIKGIWYMFLYLIIIFVVGIYIKCLYYFAYWIELTIHYFNLTLNPLLDERVSYYCCLYTDYVNWLIYYPAMLFYLFCFGLLVIFDILILLPTLVFLGFIVGYLFSLLGQPE